MHVYVLCALYYNSPTQSHGIHARQETGKLPMLSCKQLVLLADLKPDDVEYVCYQPKCYWYCS